MSKKIHIAYNYKSWRVHYLILNLRVQCAKHTISWEAKCNKPKKKTIFVIILISYQILVNLDFIIL